MKRVSVASALTVAGVLTAGSATALVNTRVLDSAEGQAVSANRVQLVEAQTWDAPPMASPQLATTVPATDPSTTTTTVVPVDIGGAVGPVDTPSDPTVTEHDTIHPSGRSTDRTPTAPGPTTTAVETTPPATTPAADEQVTGTLPPQYPPAPPATPPTSMPPVTSGPRPRPATTSTTAPPATSRPGPTSSTTTTLPPDD